jgi:GntR family transcriptional regulator
MTPISRRSNWPLYLQIADELRDQILNEALRPGARLPSEHELMETYGAARQTVRKAIAELKSEGLLDSERGRGVFVRARAPIVRSADELLSAQRWQDGAGSPAWGMALDGFRPDRFDLLGAALCLLGVAVIMYAPRGS